MIQSQENTWTDISSADMVDYKILQSDWLRTFWSICQEQKLSSMRSAQEHSKKYNVDYRTNSVKFSN